MADTSDARAEEASMTVLASSWDVDAVLSPPMRRQELTAGDALALIDRFLTSSTLPWTAVAVAEGPFWVFGFREWWWVVENVGDLNVFVDETAIAIDLPGCYELCDPFWLTPTFLPWWGASDRAWARRTIAALLAGTRPTSRHYPQSPPEPDFRWEARHGIDGASLLAYTQRSQQLPPT